MVTVEYSDGTREVWGNLKWNNSVQSWDWSIKGVSIHYVPDAMPSKVTHWTPMPAPAEDAEIVVAIDEFEDVFTGD